MVGLGRLVRLVVTAVLRHPERSPGWRLWLCFPAGIHPMREAGSSKKEDQSDGISLKKKLSDGIESEECRLVFVEDL